MSSILKYFLSVKTVIIAGVLCGRATWKDGIPIYAKQGIKAFEDWLNDRGVKNIKALNEVLKGAQPWYAKYGGLEKIQKKGSNLS